MCGDAYNNYYYDVDILIIQNSRSFQTHRVGNSKLFKALYYTLSLQSNSGI